MKEIKELSILGIDQSSRSCGIAIFKGTTLTAVRTLTFADKYSLKKLEKIIKTFNDLISFLKPDIVIIEEPLVLHSGVTTKVLNQIAGAILTVAYINGAELHMIHNATVKRWNGIVGEAKGRGNVKAQSVKIVNERYKIECANSDESDAVLLVDTYVKLKE